MAIMGCAIGAVLLAWFQAFNLGLVLTIPLYLFSGFRFELFLRMEGVQGQAGLIMQLTAIPFGILSYFLIKRVYDWSKKNGGVAARVFWIITLVIYIAIPTLYLFKNVSILDNKNPKNVLVWDEQNKMLRVVPRESMNDKFVWDKRMKAYRVLSGKTDSTEADILRIKK